ncbi:50S ribosomal protein L10 [Candidatus Cytomitobacter primus]|uniref:Large ribosomal subunit protein uL10 n=1 Tax=Candidatus Cytomitobacter primus TaxID=2066024 RepID=A0A5C0UF18_9PROT|nr:50S ribosomal protein L10 [Candidatus Cytomitobacter primus]QEK38369.1 50S ribosomal protein L10 [Candidatus Cytomitobacter primus]
MNRARKEALVKSLSEDMSGNSYVYVYGQNNVSVSELSLIRLDAAYANINMKFIKNTLAKRVVSDLKIDPLFEKVSVVFYGSGDPLEAAQVISRYEREYKGRFVAKGGSIDSFTCDKAMVDRMASVGSVDGLKAMLLGMLQAPVANFARVLSLASEKIGKE